MGKLCLGAISSIEGGLQPGEIGHGLRHPNWILAGRQDSPPQISRSRLEGFNLCRGLEHHLLLQGSQRRLAAGSQGQSQQEREVVPDSGPARLGVSTGVDRCTVGAKGYMHETIFSNRRATPPKRR